jgi:hypothetical protein
VFTQKMGLMFWWEGPAGDCGAVPATLVGVKECVEAASLKHYFFFNGRKLPILGLNEGTRLVGLAMRALLYFDAGRVCECLLDS